MLFHRQQKHPGLGRRPNIEFRIPISPTVGFASQVRLFNAALRRLGGLYARATIKVYVGDHCDEATLEWLRGAVGSRYVHWVRIPDAITAAHGIRGTADYRLIDEPDPDTDFVILSDADTVLVQPIDALLAGMHPGRAEVAGHMAHRPPPVEGEGVPERTSPDLWPFLFERFDIPWPGRVYPYSIDPEHRFAPIPAYFNLGFVVITRAALPVLGEQILPVQARLAEIVTTWMCCQISLTLICYAEGIPMTTLAAAYNAANDPEHLGAHGLGPEDIRVLHYLRGTELDRNAFVRDRQAIRAFLQQPLSDPANRLLQATVRRVRRRLLRDAPASPERDPL